MKNLFISEMNKKDCEHITSDVGLKIRKKVDKPFKKLCNIFTNANIIRINPNSNNSDDEYFASLKKEYIPLSSYNLKNKKNNIILERYPTLDKDESYIFVCNHTCPEDIETVLNILDRNAYLILGSIESLKYNPEMYLSWLNGMIPFDIMNKDERKEVLSKMKRVLKTNSILIFPEGSHNYSPNKLVNNLFDGPVNLALETGKKIVIVTLLRDDKNNVSYIDASNPIDISKIGDNLSDKLPYQENKKRLKNKTLFIRDKMATAIYYMIERHIKQVKRDNYTDIEAHYLDEAIKDAFKKLKWQHDVFDAEYLTKKTPEEKEYEEVINTLSNLRLNMDTIRKTGLNHREYILKSLDLKRKDIVSNMRNYWINQQQESNKTLCKKR